MATRKATLGLDSTLGFGGHFQFSNMELLQGFEQKDDMAGEQKDGMAGLMSEASFWLCKDRAWSLLWGSVSIQMKTSGFLVEYHVSESEKLSKSVCI